MRKFLNIGHPRSGTGFTSKLLKKFAYDVGHEVLGEDGISSWMFAVEEDQFWGPRGVNRKNYEFEHLIMNIRKPLDIISSVLYTENTVPVSYNLRAKYIDFTGLNEIEKAVKSVLGWYKIIQAQNPELILKVDANPEQTLYYYLRYQLEEDVEFPLETLPTNVNARKHSKLSYEEIKKNCTQELIIEYRFFCDFYGYSYS
ncbi:hypothetical protein SAMN06265827_101172 [Orenia metallireducens]|uniref:Sulfotransferase family protein n=1 Tax=Orenia metallireducens TaxID=1413210 RepID=A0A285F6S3_9FIRM|nr:hypothetical protein [Orenia metallireducens]SNY05901.1 hypothetical protein SAMN06265827_101172 [Orenia metallireducens]